MASKSHQRIYIFDQPRTCSMLFHRLLSEHPQLGHIFHPFSGTNGGDSPDIRRLLEPQPQKLASTTYESVPTTANSEATLHAKIHDIEEDGKTVCLKDHLFSLMRQDIVLFKDESATGKENPTRRFSDAFLLSITHPIFLIRHPALMIRSFWDAQQTVFNLQPDEDVFMALTTFRWTSVLYDWYSNHGGVPIVIDAYDIVYNTALVMESICSTVGINPAGVRYEWPTQEPEGHMSKMFMRKLQGSTGVDRESGTTGRDVVDLEAQTEAWKQVWSEDVAMQLRRRVEEEMPIYERLQSRAMKF